MNFESQNLIWILDMIQKSGDTYADGFTGSRGHTEPFFCMSSSSRESVSSWDAFSNIPGNRGRLPLWQCQISLGSRLDESPECP
jgi:hypothetical protein